MSFKHVAVRDLPRHAPSDFVRATEEGWHYRLDGIPVVPELYVYGRDLQKASPTIKFMAAHTLSYYTDEKASEVSVCMPTSPYVVCRIGFGQYREKQGCEPTYMVASRRITNDKYDGSRKQYHMRMTVNIKGAVKNALAQLVPYSVKEIAAREYDPLESKSLQVGRVKASRLPALLNVPSEVLLNEIRALHAMGVAFTTPEFKAIVEGMDEAVQLANSERSKRVDAVMVHFVESGGVMQAHCIEVHNIRNNFRGSPAGDAVIYEMNAVPQFIVEKVSVLQSLDNGSHVDSIGMKVDEKLFWVEK